MSGCQKSKFISGPSKVQDREDCWSWNMGERGGSYRTNVLESFGSKVFIGYGQWVALADEVFGI